MPSENQNILLDAYGDADLAQEADFGKCDYARLKSAFGNHKNSLYKTDKVTKYEVGEGAAKKQYTGLTSENVREFYRTKVLRGSKTIVGSGFAGTANLDYKGLTGPPDLTDLPGEGPDTMAKQGLLGSTIQGTGLGPNLNVHPIDSISERVMVSITYTSSPPFPGDGTASPSTLVERYVPVDATDDTLPSMPPGIKGKFGE